MLTEDVFGRYLKSLIAGDTVLCSEIINQLNCDSIDLKELYIGVFQRSLYRIGDLWESNRVSVATEHLATAITERLIASVYPRVLSDRHRSGRKALISCSTNEYHQIGARMVADIMELHGWDVWFLGANTPDDDLLKCIEDKSPDFLGLSLSIFFNMASFVRLIKTVRGNFPSLNILIGGQAFRWGGHEITTTFPNVYYVPTLYDLDKEI